MKTTEITFELLDKTLIYVDALNHYTEEMGAVRCALHRVRELLVEATNYQGPELDLHEYFREER